MEPKFVEKQFCMVGLEKVVELHQDFSEELDDLRNKVVQQIGEIKNKVEPIRMIGVWQAYIESDKPKRIYFSGVEVENTDDIPEGFIKKILPKSAFAVFAEQQRGVATNYAYTQWLPKSGKKLNDDLRADMEIFHDLEHYGENDPCEVYIPIQGVEE